MITSYFTETVKIYHEVRNNLNEIVSTAFSYPKCRIEHKYSTVKTMTGQIITSEARILVGPTTNVKAGQRCELNGEMFMIHAVEDKKDFNTQYRILYI